MPPIDRSRRDLSIGGIKLVWEVQEHLDPERSLKIDEDLMGHRSRVVKIWESSEILISQIDLIKYVPGPPRPV